MTTDAGITWALFLMLGTSIALGALAQTWKGRTGAFWGIASLLLLLGAYFGWFIYIDPNNTNVSGELFAVHGFTTSIFVCALIAAIIATLPSRKNR